MKQYAQIRKNEYHDSLELLLATSILCEMDGIGKGNIAMGNAAGKALFDSLGLSNPLAAEAGIMDVIIVAQAQSEEAFTKAVEATFQQMRGKKESNPSKHFDTTEAAVRAHPEAQLCVISVPGEYAKAEAMRALEAGLHVILFSSHISPEDELELKQFAQSRGLLVMGPDCGVVNLAGVAFLLGSVTARGPFGLCGATGVGIQHVGALLQAAGSGASQIIGTGGGDLKQPVGGISMLMGIDALENDPATEYILLVSRKPNEETLAKILARVKECSKVVVACFMGCEREVVESSGAIYAATLDEVAVKALEIVGKKAALQSEAELDEMAAAAVAGMKPGQRYVRGLFTGGTYCEEAMNAFTALAGDVYSNAPLSESLRLEDSLVSFQNSCVDCGEDEFTAGKPHPTMEPSVRRPFIIKEAGDPEVCVLLLDFIFAVSAHMDPVGVVIEDIKQGMAAAAADGRKLAVVASICGTDSDFQSLGEQRAKLEEAGVLVCQTNYLAARLAGKIVALRNGGKG